MKKNKAKTKEEDLEKEVQDPTEERNDEKQENNGKEGKLSEVDELKEQLDKEKDKYVRLFAEFENYKRRTSKERIELFKTAGKDVMLAMLPVMDDFDRALNELRKAGENEHIAGIELIYSKLQETLKKEGLEEMPVKKGDKFDADLHEAVTQIPAPDKKLKGKIIDVIQKGYTMGDRIIRYPKVVTGA